jgi:hypothetical protein
MRGIQGPLKGFPTISVADWGDGIRYCGPARDLIAAAWLPLKCSRPGQASVGTVMVMNSGLNGTGGIRGGNKSHAFGSSALSRSAACAACPGPTR